VAKTPTPSQESGLKLFRAHLQEYRHRYAEGDNRALLLAVDLCHRTGRAVPADLATDYCDKLDAWFLDQVPTLDEAFGVERPERQHFDDRKERVRQLPRVLACVARLRKTEGLSIGPEMFVAVAKELRLTASYVEDCFYNREIEDLRKYVLKHTTKKSRPNRPVSR
jgi:hypothetical protein